MHYQVNGTGRDSYIHVNQGGFASNYAYMNDRDAYVNSLRSYTTQVGQEQKVLQANATKTGSPRRDFFVEGQISIRSPKARNGLNMLKTYQRMQNDRLAQPKRDSSAEFRDIQQTNKNSRNLDGADSQRSNFLRKTTQGFGGALRGSPSFVNENTRSGSLQGHLAE